MSALRIAIYGRHSTTKQTATSSSDQAAACGKLVNYLGGTVVDVYLDPELSGYRRDRPGLRRLLADVRAGRIDIVVTEALDRLARDAEDVAWIGKKFKFDRVGLHTVTEGSIDEIKLAVASLLGGIFLTQLQQKTLRGMEAAVIAGRFAGGRAYGYRRATRLDAKGERIKGLLEIDPAHAAIVQSICSDFANGLSAIEIAKRLNGKRIPGPRGGLWNASTIRGDPKKAVGILNNPLYRGKLVWKRRHWQRNPDSERRERQYRLRDPSEWIEIDVPDLRIIDDVLWRRVQAELERRQRPHGAAGTAACRRQRHLLSGLIKCAECGSSYVISGKDYYRCANHKERGTCSNRLAIRKDVIESATLATLRGDLLTAEHTKIFVEEFRRETNRLGREQQCEDGEIAERLRQVEAELANLGQNMLAGLLSPTLSKLLAEREAEKDALEAQLAAITKPSVRTARILPHPALLALFEQKVSKLCNAFNDEAVRGEAASIISRLIESVTIHPDGPNGPEAEVVAKVSDLLAFATNDNAAPGGGVGSSITVVAGTGSGPKHTIATVHA